MTRIIQCGDRFSEPQVALEIERRTEHTIEYSTEHEIEHRIEVSNEK